MKFPPERRIAIGRCMFLAVALIATTMLSGCNTMPSEVRDRIAERLPTMLGPADRYDVHVDGDIFGLLRGRLRSVRIDGDNVALSPGLRVHSFHADAEDIHANTRTDAIESIGSVTFDIVLDQGNLNRFMRTQKPDDWERGARATLGMGNITYSDNVDVLGLATPFSISGVLTPKPGHPNQLNFVPSSGQFIKIPVPRKLLAYAVDRVNPVVDLSRMTYPVAIESARVKRNQMLIDGSVDLSSLIGTNPAAAPRPPG
jgi:hypothetical protein